MSQHGRRTTVWIKASIFLEGYYHGVLKRPKIFASFS